LTLPTKTLVAALTAAAALACSPAMAPAIVPPRDCGNMTISGKRYQIKVDQISCRDGKAYTKTYIQRRRKPRGYRCDRYTPRRNRVLFQCNNGRKVFFAIRR
jgi:hypothetical protein